jgi:hypothetical protein
MGFKKELVSIFGPTRGRRSTWLFSATFPDSIHALVKGANPLFPASNLRRLLRRGYEGQEGYDRQAGLAPGSLNGLNPKSILALFLAFIGLR